MLREKTMLVTGANRGIGRAIVEKFASQGLCIFACARKQTDAFEKDMRTLADKFSVDITPIYFDIERREEIKAAVKQIVSAKKPIDILINNAGITTRNTFHMSTMEEIERVYMVNFFNAIYLTQMVSRLMIRKRSGVIINIASISGIENAEGTLAYGGSKSSVVWSTKTLAAELGKYNIRVNAIAPGLIDTDMISYHTEEQRTDIIKQSCLGRIGKAEDVANAVYFLASEEASYITGQILRVDGGRV